MKRTLLAAIFIFSSAHLFAQETNNASVFWEKLKAHCGKAYEGRMADSTSVRGFSGKRLVMHVRACDENTIRIPFFVGDDRSRTWVLTYLDGRITLKHDHRHEDGSEEENTQYGGTATNGGFPHMQVFPADAETASRIASAATNIWWITLDDKAFTYNLRRVGAAREVNVVFDLTNPIDAPEAPWGWKD